MIDKLSLRGMTAMAKGHGGMPNLGGMNMNSLMKQAQKMQQKMAEAQADLETKTLEVSAGGGAVKVVINGKKEIKELKISPEVVDSEDTEMLEDLLLSAVNEAIRQMEEKINNEMAAITGMNMPGGLF
jgi:DNA-binding YbaB/EbfC family protein